MDCVECNKKADCRLRFIAAACCLDAEPGAGTSPSSRLESDRPRCLSTCSPNVPQTRLPVDSRLLGVTVTWATTGSRAYGLRLLASVFFGHLATGASWGNLFLECRLLGSSRGLLWGRQLWLRLRRPRLHWWCLVRRRVSLQHRCRERQHHRDPQHLRRPHGNQQH